MNKLSYDSITKMDVMEFNTWLLETFSCEPPKFIETVDDLQRAGRLLAELTGMYSYISAIVSILYVETKRAKKISAKSQEAADMQIRRDCAQLAFKKVEFQYAAISRLITVKQDINNELKMLGNIT